MTSAPVIAERVGQLEIVTLNRPQKRNALRGEDCRAIAATVRQATVGRRRLAGLSEDAVDGATDSAGAGEPARAILIRGAGSVFCAGADLSDGVYAQGFLDDVMGMIHAIVDSPVPVIADVQGPAVGAGCQLILACDMRVFGERGVCWVPVAQHGFALDAWTHERAVELWGGSVARNVFLGGARLSAAQALQIGFAVQQGSAEAALDFATAVAAQAPLSMEHSKRLLNSAQPAADEQAERFFHYIWASEDAAEARAAREQKRPPKFTAR